MADPFKDSRLGDLPNAGYATQRERELTDLICDFMRKIERDRTALLLIVVGGRQEFKRQCQKVLGGFTPADDLLDHIWYYFQRQAGQNPLGQLEALSRMTNRERYGLM